MRVAVSLFPLRPHQITEVAVEAERLGFGGVWIGEHVISPIEMRSAYPYAPSTTDAPAYHAHLPFYDPYAALCFIAARTEHIRLGLSLSIVPLHDPYHLARSVATVDLLSAGRFLFGVGAGWLKEEFDIVGQPWEGRGARLEEALALMVRLWNDDEPSFEGRFWTLPPSAMEPKPLTRPHPPFFFGGTTAIALDRTARLGDGWIGVGLQPAQAASLVARIHQLRAEHGRQDLPFEVALIMADAPDPEVMAQLEADGVQEIVVRPWIKGRDALANLRAYAGRIGLTPA